MSPRRMDISSLLRDPSPPRDDAHRPRAVDALHPPPPSLLALLNSPARADSSLRALLPHTDQPRPRPPFLGLDALVHVASEERRRITAPDRDSERDLSLPTYLDRDRFTERDHPAVRPHSFVHDHDRPPRHYSHPLLPPPFQDNSRPHKRTRDAGPLSPSRSPSPEPGFPLVLSSPRTRHHPSASPTSSYPTLRRQPMEPTRSAPALLAGPVNDSRTIPAISLRHTSPFLHSLRPSQVPIHSSPRNNSPHRHSPQHLRSQHHPHSSPIQPGAFVPVPADADPMPPRYGYGPKMAGGIEVLSNDPSFIRELSRPDLSNYQSQGRDVSTERFVSEPRVDHAMPEQTLSPLPGRAYSPDDHRRQVMALPNQAEGQESMLLRERARPCPPHSPLVDGATDSGNSVGIPEKGAHAVAQPPPERHPIRVWEEQPGLRDTSRRVSPVHIPAISCSPTLGHTWLRISESAHVERPAKNERETELRQDGVGDVLTPPSSTRKEPPPPRSPTLEPLLSDLRRPNERTRPDPQPLTLPTPTQPRSPIQFEARAFLPQASLLNSTPCVPASPVLDLHLKNFETHSELQSGRSDTQVDASTGAPSTSSDPSVTEPLLGKVELMPDTDNILMANPLPLQPSPELVRPVPAKESGALGMLTYSIHVDVSQSKSRSPSQQPFSILLPAKDKHNALPDDTPNTPLIQPEPPLSEQTMMDVDEELLSLVEDRPVRAVPTMPKVKTELRLPLPTTEVQGTGAGVKQGSSQGSDGPSFTQPSQPIPKGPPVITDEEKDRASMPPPAARNRKTDKDKTTLTAGTASGSRKKKDGSSKPVAKPKQPSKPRAKPAPKPRARPNVVDASSKGSAAKGAVNVTVRSRSTSIIPSTVDDAVHEPEADGSDKEDEKLYCVCKTRYDEDRMMIACDRCDEWFHTLCVNIPDLEIDLVDQFTCPPCIQKHPQLRTTWKRRCLFGLQHEKPSSLEACHKPSRGTFSKYCSDDCGIKYMQVHITQWEKSGGARGLLWESVKNATKREGVVVCAETNGASPPMDIDCNNSQPKRLDSAAKRRAERDIARLNARLEEVVKEREFMKRELDMVMWRERVVELASERAGKVDECGWDQRLCFGEEEWADFGPEVLESYEERVKAESEDDTTPLDTAFTMHGEWWCTGKKKKCERHAGWQKLRAAEVSFDKETKEDLLLKLTTREREIRKCIEDILYPQPTGTLQAPPHPESQFNGSEKSRSVGHVSEGGKKRSP